MDENVVRNGLAYLDAIELLEYNYENQLSELTQKYNGKITPIVEIPPFINKIDFINELKTANFITEASLIGDDVKRIILGVGPITAHEVNENITIESYKKLIEQYKELIYKVLS